MRKAVQGYFFVLRSTVRTWAGVFAASPVVRRLVGGSAVLIGVILLLTLVAASVGPFSIPISHTVIALLDWSGLRQTTATGTEQAVIENVRVLISHAVTALLDWSGLGQTTATGTERAIIGNIRLPRIALALSVGAALGVSGAVMQGLFRNPMADPGIIGVSTGGSLGAVIAIATGAAAASLAALPAFAFVGAMGALLLVYAIANAGGRFSMATLLLAGVAVSAFLGAIVSAIILFTNDQQAQREMIFWLAGGLDSSRWADVRVALPVIAAGVLIALVFTRDLNLLLVGEDEARALGVRVDLVRNLLLVCASLVTGAAVAFSGTIAFVGLVVPHTLRLFVGADHRVLLPLSALGGAAFLLAADTAARLLISPAELRVGIITAFFGAPFFLFLLMRNKSRAGSL
ncbi:MAG: iron chelate uptake ABC transporter family permease subunit [Dehalococcoidia bacterium]